MQTVFSHIIQKRFSQQYEDVATDALAFILASSEAAGGGMNKLLRGLEPDLPDLRFRTQQSEDAMRPDMWGYDGSEPRVFVENKFWAGLTDNQPVAYLRKLETFAQPTVLLVIAPAERQHTLWRELTRRLEAAGIMFEEMEAVGGISRCARTAKGSILALTSWSSVLAVLEQVVVDDPAARSDLAQLRSLCSMADQDAFIPFSAEELTDQRMPALILQLNTIVQQTVDAAAGAGFMSTGGTRPQASWERIGRYANLFAGELHAGAWLGIQFELWKRHGIPLWLCFNYSKWGKGRLIERLLEAWAARHGFVTENTGGYFSLSMDLPAGEEQAEVVRELVDRIAAVAAALQERFEIEDEGEEAEEGGGAGEEWEEAGEEQNDEPSG